MTVLKAIIFDFNGVIIDDEDLHFRSFAETLKEEKGTTLSEAEYYRTYLGVNDKGCFQREFPELKMPAMRVLIERKTVHYRRMLEEKFVLFPSAAELVCSLSTRVPIAIASGSHFVEIDYVLSRSGLSSCFTVIVGSDRITNGKPNPEVFLRTLEALQSKVSGLTAAECAVLEDAPNGIRAAKAAGMRALGVASTVSREKLVDADAIVYGLAELSFERIAALLGYVP